MIDDAYTPEMRRDQRLRDYAQDVTTAARVKQMFVPVTYAVTDGDSLERRMLKKIHNITATVKHRGTPMTDGELRQIHSAAFAAIDGPDPDYGL